MADHAKRDLARAVREAYERTDIGDDAARERLLDRLRHAPPPRRAGGGWPHGLPHGLQWLAAAGHEPGMRAALVAAGLLILVGGGLVTRAVDLSRAPVTPVDAVATAGHETLVRFELHAPGAERVTLVGDFNDWDPIATPMRCEAAADRWSVSLPVSRGRHLYGFVVDRKRWLPDPAAPLAPEDGFGARNSVILVGDGT